MMYEEIQLSPQRDRAAWLEDRRSRVGASEVAAVLGLDPHRSAIDVYAEKILGPTDASMPEEVDATGAEYYSSEDRSEWGHIVEPVALARYGAKRGVAVEHFDRSLVSTRYPWLGCTPDGWQQRGASRAPVQVKTTGKPDLFDEGIPLRVQVQLQAELLVTAAEMNTLVYVVLNEWDLGLGWIDVSRHAEFQALVLEETEAFMRRVQRREPPDPDGSRSAADALARLYSADETKAIILGEDALAVVAEYEAAKEQARAAERTLEAVKQTIAATMREATYAALPDGRAWTYKAQDRARYKCEQCGHAPRTAPYRVLRLSNAFARKAESKARRSRRGRV